MKKILLGLAGFIALAVPASAADLAVRPYSKAPPPMIAAIYDWSGFYIGANGGWGFSHQRRDICPFVIRVSTAPLTKSRGPAECHDPTGALYRGQIRYQ